MKHPGRIRIVQCTATGDDRYDELVGHTVSTIASNRDHYIIDEFKMKGSWAVYMEVRKADCKLLPASSARRTKRTTNQRKSSNSNTKKQPNSL